MSVAERPQGAQEALGISRSRYYEIVEAGLLPYTRPTPGGVRVHLRQHIDEYLNYLASQPKGGEKLKGK